MMSAQLSASMKSHMLSVSGDHAITLSYISANVTMTDAFIRDELSKGRYDPAIAGICFQMLLELYSRVLRSDLGPSEAAGEPENVC